MRLVTSTYNNSTKLLPIVIPAHNEEKVISKAIESALSQITPAGYSVRVIVVANACTDRTDDIVNRIGELHPNKVQLTSIREKGKTKAINKAIRLFDEISSSGIKIPYVIFLDADCEFVGNEALVNFLNGFEGNLRLCAISANCVPDVCFNSRKDIVSETYRAMHALSRSVRFNSISGMCYGIRFDVLRKLEFPDFQFAEDMYVSSRLNGWFYNDVKINISYKTPPDLRSEINRRIRQEISTRRYREYYSYLKQKGVRVELFEKPLGQDYRWGRVSNDSFVKVWLNLKGVKVNFFAIIFFLIVLWANINAPRRMRAIRNNKDLDYWKILR